MNAVPDDCPEMITLFHITGVMIYVDPWGKQTGYEDVFIKVEDVPGALRSRRTWRGLPRPAHSLSSPDATNRKMGNGPLFGRRRPGAVEAVRRKVEDFGGKMLGKPIEVVGSA